MKSLIKISCILFYFIISAVGHAENLREATLRKAALKGGLVPASDTWVPVNEKKVQVGKLIFESKLLSPSGTIACSTCHVDRFGSSDGLPLAIGIGGKGLGKQRYISEGRLLPRNTLPFWGRGGKGFETFFWDGKVYIENGVIVSQFGPEAPSDDPLIMAVHLPPVELREMVGEDAEGENLQTETVASANILYKQATQRLLTDKAIRIGLTKAFQKKHEEITFLNIANATAQFIRYNYAVQSTKFHKFTFENGRLSDEELRGGLIFYGRGGCIACHNGPYFSDMKFHAIPFPPIGAGKNGFGIDYGRYNVTSKPSDRGLFRTPPLYNVTKTAPYSHSGSIDNLKDAIMVHMDPLSVRAMVPFSLSQRLDFYRQLKTWASEPISESVLTNSDLDDLISFVRTLNYKSRFSVDSN